jgi:hypothetical protein
MAQKNATLTEWAIVINFFQNYMDLTEAVIEGAQRLGIKNASQESLRQYIIDNIEITPIESVVAYKYELQRVGNFETLRALESQKFFKSPMNDYMKHGINRPLEAMLPLMLKYLMKHGAGILGIEIRVPRVETPHMAYYSRLVKVPKDGHIMVIEWNHSFRVLKTRFIKGADDYMKRVAMQNKVSRLTNRVKFALGLTWPNLANETGPSNFMSGKIAADAIHKQPMLLKMYPEDTFNEEDIRRAYGKLRTKYPKSKVSLRIGNDFSKGEDNHITFWILNTHEGRGCHWYALYHLPKESLLKMFDPMGGKGETFIERRNDAIVRIRKHFDITNVAWSKVRYQLDSDQYNCGAWCLWKATLLMQGIDDTVLMVPLADGSLSRFTNASAVSIPILRNMVTNNYVR